MGIKVKAIERNVAFEKGKQKWAYVMQADLYGQLTQSKVIEEVLFIRLVPTPNPVSKKPSVKLISPAK